MKMVNKADVVKIEDLTIENEYLFATILLQNKSLTKQLIEKFIGVDNNTDIDYVNTEESQKATFNSKGVRFDVYIKDQSGVAYIVELQRKDTKELAKRARYYQAISDTRNLPKGNPYRNLKDNYVIFICREDVFGHGLYKYSFKNTCAEVKGLALDDGTHKIFFNTKGTKGEICEDILAFLRLVEGQTSANLLMSQWQQLKLMRSGEQCICKVTYENGTLLTVGQSRVKNKVEMKVGKKKKVKLRKVC